jgi:hypothetical protein
VAITGILLGLCYSRAKILCTPISFQHGDEFHRGRTFFNSSSTCIVWRPVGLARRDQSRTDHSTSVNCISSVRSITEKLSSETIVSTVSPSAVT